jgi:NADPH-dependent 2,4-dienoyl-CoA reductase/sulfur reductase-like enzyme/rhodanese-related sulfurtransferase
VAVTIAPKFDFLAYRLCSCIYETDRVVETMTGQTIHLSDSSKSLISAIRTRERLRAFPVRMKAGCKKRCEGQEAHMHPKLLIIGGVAGGATAAARARRLNEHASIILFERGEHISFANCGLPYYIGGVIPKREHLLVTTIPAFRDRYNIDIRVFSEVTRIDRNKKEVEVKNLRTGESYGESYDRIILAPGAEPIRPPIPGIDAPNIFSLRNIPDSDRIAAGLVGHQEVVIVGAGFIALEMAENLVSKGCRVTIIEMLDQVMNVLDYEMAAIVQRHLEAKGVICKLERTVTRFEKRGDRVFAFTDKDEEVEADVVLMTVGVRPENRLAREAGLDIGQTGAIRVNAAMATSDPDIFAVGDVAEVKDLVTGAPVVVALAGPANKQGRIAADNAMGRHSEFRGTLGTSIAKVFDLSVASTGASEKRLNAHKIPYLVTHVHPPSHASYYPGSRTMTIKLLFSPVEGRVLGAQAVGMDGVDKRIDVLATAMKAGMTVYDLEELELAYAPPYSSAKDPVNIAGFAAANILKGDVEQITWNELPDMDCENEVLLDLRGAGELAAEGSMPDAVHIPLPELRRRLPELDKSKRYVTLCAAGLRSYIAHRMLVQHGFKSRSLGGGFSVLKGVRERIRVRKK